MKYSIIIPTYNHCDDLLKPCVEAIIKYSRLEEIELIIVANGCKDETSEYLKYLEARFARTNIGAYKYLIFEQPLGYSGANNKGINIATCDKIVLLNNDAFLLDQSPGLWTDLLNAPFDTNGKCGITCLIKGHSDPAGQHFAVFFCVMIHRKVFDTIGLLNEEYGVGGGEDTEFSIEAERAGFEVVPVVPSTYDPASGLMIGNFPIYHKGEGTMHDPTLVPEWNDIFVRNSLKLAKKYNPQWYYNKLAELERSSKTQDLVNSNLTPAQEFSWMKEIPEFKNMYDEVIASNTYKILPDYVRDKTVIDIGANIGCFTLLTASMGAKNIIAVEPVSKTFEHLRNNINRAGYNNIKTLNFAVTDKNNSFVKIPIQQDSGHNSMYSESTDSYVEIIETITLSKILSEVDSDINDIFLKIDCEGGEYDILLSATKKDMKRIDTVVLEIHAALHPEYKGFDLIHNQLKKFGFAKCHEDQMYTITVDGNGNHLNYDPLPIKQEFWSKTIKQF